jgi:hypothetical protein
MMTQNVFFHYREVFLVFMTMKKFGDTGQKCDGGKLVMNLKLSFFTEVFKGES